MCCTGGPLPHSQRNARLEKLDSKSKTLKGHWTGSGINQPAKTDHPNQRTVLQGCPLPQTDLRMLSFGALGLLPHLLWDLPKPSVEPTKKILSHILSEIRQPIAMLIHDLLKSPGFAVDSGAAVACPPPPPLNVPHTPQSEKVVPAGASMTILVGGRGSPPRLPPLELSHTVAKSPGTCGL